MLFGVDPHDSSRVLDLQKTCEAWKVRGRRMMSQWLGDSKFTRQTTEELELRWMKTEVENSEAESTSSSDNGETEVSTSHHLWKRRGHTKPVISPLSLNFAVAYNCVLPLEPRFFVLGRQRPHTEPCTLSKRHIASGKLEAKLVVTCCDMVSYFGDWSALSHLNPVGP